MIFSLLCELTVYGGAMRCEGSPPLAVVTVVSSTSPHFTLGNLSCSAFRICNSASLYAVLTTMCFLWSRCPILVRCAFRSCARLYVCLVADCEWIDVGRLGPGRTFCLTLDQMLSRSRELCRDSHPFAANVLFPTPTSHRYPFHFTRNHLNTIYE